MGEPSRYSEPYRFRHQQPHNNYWHKAELIRVEMERNAMLDERLALMLVPAALAAIGICAILLAILA